jgi:hypothetical protein
MVQKRFLSLPLSISDLSLSLSHSLTLCLLICPPPSLRIPESRDYELVLKRYLETPNMGLGSRAVKKDTKLRLVTVKINLKTGERPLPWRP